MAREQHLSGTNREEQWREIPGFEGYYEVSDQGRVRSMDRIVQRTNHSSMKIRSKLLVEQFRPDTGYYSVKLSKNNRKKNWYVHRLVLMAFVGLPEDGQEACHGNDIRTDNRLENLRWDTHKENVRDAVRRGRLRNAGREMTHCRRGHLFTEESRRGNRRVCYPCKRLTERRRYHAKKAA